MSSFSSRIHPLVAVAAVSVTLVSGLGIAAITGVLPVSHGLAVGSNQPASERATNSLPYSANEPPSAVHTKNLTSRAVTGKGPSESPDTNGAPTTQHKPVAQNSPVGIGVGALIGGVIGNQFGSGDGKALATIAGAVGGGYIGNEVAMKNQTKP